MDLVRLINLLIRTLNRRGVIRDIHNKTTGNKNRTPAERARSLQINQTMRKGMRAMRLLARFGRF